MTKLMPREMRYILNALLRAEIAAITAKPDGGCSYSDELEGTRIALLNAFSAEFGFTVQDLERMWDNAPNDIANYEFTGEEEMGIHAYLDEAVIGALSLAFHDTLIRYAGDFRSRASVYDRLDHFAPIVVPHAPEAFINTSTPNFGAL